MGNPVMQWQILAKDPDQMAAFYAGLFGWKVDADNPMGYRQVDTGSPKGISGGIWPSPPEGHSFVQLFIEVEDIDASFARAQELGAGVIVPPQALPGGDRLAILLGPENLSFGLMQSAKPADG